MQRSATMRRPVLATAAVLAAVAGRRRTRRPDVGVGSPLAPASPPRPLVAVFAVAVVVVLAGAVTAPDEPAATIVLPDVALDDEVLRPPSPRPVAAVAPAQATMRIDIPGLGVSAPVDEVGLHDDGTLVVPDDVTRAGWYRGLDAPGQVGTAVIVGHLDSHTGPAVFFRVPELGAGDELTVTLADGTAVVFVVERTEQYDKQAFPTIAVYGPSDRRSLRLITCGGTFDKRRRSYSDNVVVYAHAKEPT